MGKKKREHVVFDQMLKQKKSIPFSIVNKETTQKQNKKVRYWSRDEIENIVKVSLEFDCMASYCGDGDCVVIYSN